MPNKERFNWFLISKYRTEMYGISAVMIVIFHMQNIVPYPYKLSFFPVTISYITDYFNTGVDNFLLLSGISLYFALSKKPKYSLFIKKRFVRVIIPYLLISIPYFIYYDIFFRKSLLNLFLDITGISLVISYNDGKWILFAKTMWYVSFAVYTYLIYPLLYKFLFGRNEKNHAGIKTLLLIILSVIFTLSVKKMVTADYFAIVEIYLTRIPVFLLGCYLGKFVCEKRELKKTDISLTVLSLCMIVPFWYFYNHTFTCGSLTLRRYFGLFIAFDFCFIVPIILELINSIKLNKLLCFFGKISLEIYITHMYLYHIVENSVIPGIKESESISQFQKFLVYICVFTLSVIISEMFSLIYNKVIMPKIETHSQLKR